MPSMIATVGVDKMCRIWDINQLSSTGKNTKPVKERDLKQGNLHSLQFYQDEAWVLAAGGSKGELCIWDTEESSVVRAHFEKEAGSHLTPNCNKGKKQKDLSDNEMAVEDDDNSDFEDLSDESSEQEVVTKSKTSAKKPGRKGKW